MKPIPFIESGAAHRKLDEIFRGVHSVTDRRKQDWLDQVARVDPKRVEWHVDRLMGIGGSEIGTFVSENNQLGGSVFTTARRIIAGKLLYAAPERSTVSMLVGARLEDDLREAFHLEMEKFECATDEQSYRQIAEMQHIDNVALRKRPWLVGNPDDIVLLHGKRYVVDYKVTLVAKNKAAAAEAEAFEVFSDYPYQLHHYAAILNERGIKVDGLLLAKWVPDEDGYFSLNIGPVPLDSAKLRAIYVAGDKGWAYRCRGELPEFPERKRVDFVAENPDANIVVPAVEKFYAYKMIADQATKAADDCKDVIRDVLRQYAAPEKASLKLCDLVSASISPELDMDSIRNNFGEKLIEAAQGPGDHDMAKLKAAVVSLCEQAGQDPVEVLDECRGMVLDTEKLALLLREQGASIESFMAPKATIRLAGGKDFKAESLIQSIEHVEQGRDKLLDLIGYARSEGLFEPKRAARKKKVAATAEP